MKLWVYLILYFLLFSSCNKDGEEFQTTYWSIDSVKTEYRCASSNNSSRERNYYLTVEEDSITFYFVSMFSGSDSVKFRRIPNSFNFDFSENIGYDLFDSTFVDSTAAGYISAHGSVFDNGEMRISFSLAGGRKVEDHFYYEQVVRYHIFKPANPLNIGDRALVEISEADLVRKMAPSLSVCY